MPVETLRPIANGSLILDGAQGFYPEPAGTAFWDIVKVSNIVDGQSTRYVGWAVENENPPGVRMTVKLGAAGWAPGAIISYIKCFFIGAGGVDANQQPVTPSGTGNAFSIGLFLPNGSSQIVQNFTFTDYNWATFTATFNTNPLTGSPWDYYEVYNMEWLLSYGRYWTTSDKSYSVNDNAHNVAEAAWVEISYTAGVASSTGGMILHI